MMTTYDNKNSAVNWPWEMMTDCPLDGTWVLALFVKYGPLIVKWERDIWLGCHWCQYGNGRLPSQPIGWRPLNAEESDSIRAGTPPKNGTWILGKFETAVTTGKHVKDGPPTAAKTAWVLTHWAQDLSGEEQPPFRGWYTFRDGCQGFFEVPGKIVDWRPVSAAEQAQLASRK